MSLQHYIFIYIFVCNCIVNLLIPFILLMILNLKTYKRIQEYEQRLSNFPQFKVIFHRNAQSTNQDQEVELGVDMKLPTTDHDIHSSEADIIETETIQAATSLDQVDNDELQGDLQCFFQETKLSNNLESNGRKYRFFKSTKSRSVEEGGNVASRNQHDVIPTNSPSTTIGTSTRSFSQIESSQPFIISTGDQRKQALAVISARQREVALARVSIYIVVVFLICHTVRIIPNSFEMVQTFIHKVRKENFKNLFEKL